MTNTAAVGGAGVNLALKLLNGETVQTDPSATQPNTVLLDPVLADNLTDAGKALLEPGSRSRVSTRLWPLGLQIDGWTTYHARAGDRLQGPERLASDRDPTRGGCRHRRRPLVSLAT